MGGGSKSGKAKKREKKRLEVDMESFAEVGDKIAPFIGYFPSGFDPQRVGKADGGKDHGDGNPQIKVFRHKSFVNRLQLVVSPEQSKVDFVGSSHIGEAAATQGCTYAVGVLDRETQSLKIVPIAANKIFRLEPRLRECPDYLKEKDVGAEKSEVKMRDLTNLYGTKKEKRRVENLDASRYEGNSVAQKIVEDKLEAISFNEEAAEHVTGYNERNLPPYDLEATTPENAYPLDKIITRGEWYYLSDIMDLLQSNPGSILSTEFWQSGGYPSFVCNRIRKLGEVEDEYEKEKLAGIFSYITHLIKFKNLARHYKKLIQISNPNSSSKYQDIPVIFYQKLFRMFVDTEGVKVSTEKSDLLISYILVLTLYADGFETEISDIAKDLQVSNTTLRPYYLELGCKIKKSLSVRLPVPLKLPDLRVKKRQRR